MFIKPTCDSFSIINENVPLVAMHVIKPTIFFNKPIYCGCKILDISKLHMYQFAYEYLKLKYKENVSFLYQDTDAFILEIIIENIYENMKNDSHLFDTSDYPKEHMCYSDKNKKVIGKFKDESNGKCLNEFCALRAKMYCYTTIINKTIEKINKAKGVKKYVAIKILMDAYKDCCFNMDNATAPECYISQTLMKVVKHQIYTITQNKVGLCWFDDKRHMIDCVNQSAFGHYLN